MKKDVNLIPKGQYCYTIIGYDKKTNRIIKKNCPYWTINENRPKQENGYCSFLEIGDWEMPMGLLWDQVKECWINC